MCSPKESVAIFAYSPEIFISLCPPTNENDYYRETSLSSLASEKKSTFSEPQPLDFLRAVVQYVTNTKELLSSLVIQFHYHNIIFFWKSSNNSVIKKSHSIIFSLESYLKYINTASQIVIITFIYFSDFQHFNFATLIKV